MTVPCKSLQHIRTLSGSIGTGSHSKERHIHHFKIGCLELERTRKATEKQAAEKHIQRIDIRLREIENEIRQRQSLLAKTGSDEVQRGKAPGRDERSRRKVLRY
jgi:hypothetical protein